MCELVRSIHIYLLKLKKLLELPIHSVYCLFGAFYNSLKQLPGLLQGHLSLLLFSDSEILESSIEIVSYFRLDLWR